MPDLIPQYTFLPWLRRGIVGLVDAVPATERLSVALTLHVHGEGDQPVTRTVPRKAELLGPGDVSGINARAIVRTVPRAGVRDFEANYLPAIEFYDEDFPWRYSPALPTDNRPRPWIWLVALTEGEYKRQGLSAGKLPVIEITPQALGDAFPDPDTTTAWAHVHLNFGVPATELKDAVRDVERILNENADLGCARLLCPRRLQPNVSYTVFLVPAFEKGRLAGLGHAEAAIDATPNQQASWPKKAAVSGPLAFPVYYEWRFATSSAGDFEDLARLLRPADAKALLGGGRLLDIQEPGWGQKYRSQAAGRAQPGAVVLESALRIPISTAPDAPKDPQEKLYFGKDTVADQKFANDLMPLLNLGVEPLTKGVAHAQPSFFPDGNLEDDPIVVPPLYGSYYKVEKKLAATNDWYKQLNTNPVYRIAAGNGATVIQEGQEEYMNRAWDQLSSLTETASFVRRWQFSLQLSEALYAKRLKESMTATATPDPANAVQCARTVNLLAPMHGSLRSGTGNFVNALRGNAFAATYTRAYAKVTRTGGPLMRRFQDKPSAKPFLTAMVLQSVPVNYLKQAADEEISFLTKLLGATTASEKRMKEGFKKTFKDRGFVGIEALLEAFKPYAAMGVSFKTRPLPNDANTALYTMLADQIKPTKTIPARMRAVAGLPAPASAAAAEKIEWQPKAVEFPDPMYAALAARDPNLLLPSLERIPPNSVTVMEPNLAFIESYLIGLNHEMAREFLWREFPAALDGTFFQQFWDVRNNPGATVDPKRYKDIRPVRDWPTSPLGAAQHRPSNAASSVSIVVIRGDLLRKYPNTLVFLQKAAWKNASQRKERTVGTEVKMPIFSAQIAPDYALLGFDVSPGELKGDRSVSNQPGWFFGLKERIGEAQFGLDITQGEDPAWPQLPEVAENQCLDVESASFKSLPRYTSAQADRIAALLFQRPFQLLVHASQLII